MVCSSVKIKLQIIGHRPDGSFLFISWAFSFFLRSLISTWVCQQNLKSECMATIYRLLFETSSDKTFFFSPFNLENKNSLIRKRENSNNWKFVWVKHVILTEYTHTHTHTHTRNASIHTHIWKCIDTHKQIHKRTYTYIYCMQMHRCP